jgi:hypothetical protein
MEDEGEDLYVIKYGKSYLYWGWPNHYWADGKSCWALQVSKKRAEELASATPGAQVEKLEPAE